VEQDEIPPIEAGDPVAAAGGLAPEAEADAPADAAPPAVEVGDPLTASPAETTEPVGVEGPGVESVSPEIADAAPPAAARREPSGFLDMGAVRAAAEDSGLDLPESVYASLVAALASGKHLVISGPAGSGKTTLALAVAKAAVQAGRSAGAALATASPKWSAHDTVGRVGESGFSQGHVLAAAGRKKWLLIDEIDRAKLDKAFGDLSSFLGGLPLSLPDGSREVAAPSDWRIVATRDTSRGPLEASPALLRRFAQVHLPQPAREELAARIDTAADGDATAAGAVKRLLAADLPGLGAGAFIDAAHHAAERNALSPASEEELARECLAAYIAPHLNAEPGRIKELEDSLASPA
jgi:RecA/RadA recombinase